MIGGLAPEEHDLSQGNPLEITNWEIDGRELLSLWRRHC